MASGSEELNSTVNSSTGLVLTASDSHPTLLGVLGANLLGSQVQAYTSHLHGGEELCLGEGYTVFVC